MKARNQRRIDGRSYFLIRFAVTTKAALKVFAS